jgi:hypothetical protein
MHHRMRSMRKKPARRWQQRAAAATACAACNPSASGTLRSAVIPCRHRFPTGPLPGLDYRRDRLGGRTTLMRHALRAQPRPIATLPLSMLLPTRYAALELLSGRPHTVPAGPPAALKAAVTLATVTVRAQPERPLAPLTAHWPQPQHSTIVAEPCSPAGKWRRYPRAESSRKGRPPSHGAQQEQAPTGRKALPTPTARQAASGTGQCGVGQCRDSYLRG